MKAFLSPGAIDPVADIQITGSKSESNRLLILQALYPGIGVNNLSESDDTQVLQSALGTVKGTVDVHHAGTAMRFLTAYYACKEGAEVILTGSQRMQQRPIQILVEALRQLGAQIEYINKEGFPPLKIKGTSLTENNVQMQADVSSQYISALMLIGASLPNGLQITITGKITSEPYLKMTAHLLQKVGIKCLFSNSCIKIAPTPALTPITVTIESDWSSASYFYSVAALSKNPSITLSSYHNNSIQGDAALVEIYKSLGVETAFNASNNSITLTRSPQPVADVLKLNLINTPDLAQTIAVTCFGLGMGCELTGLHTLKIKETDRLTALKNELEKLGAHVTVTDASLQLQSFANIKSGVTINTYNDHRMAMAFAPLAVLKPITIHDAMVVTKSFPTFWEDLKSTSIQLQLQSQ